MKINKNLNVPIYMQIYESIVNYINDGLLLPCSKLEAERRLAKQLGVNRSTVTKAYKELKMDGYIDSRQGSTYQVVYRMPEFSDGVYFDNKKSSPLSYMEHNIYLRHDIVYDTSIQVVENQNMIQFGAALVSNKNIPVNEINEVIGKLTSEPNHRLYSYCKSQGLLALRKTIAKHLESKRIDTTPNKILIASEAMQLLNYILYILVRPGDCVIVGEPIFPDTYQLFAINRIRIVTIPVDEGGICTDQLEKLVKENNAKMIYTMPSFHNPTNVTMSIERRKHLLEIAYKYSIPIIEDAFNEELQYKTKPILPLKAMDVNDYVIYIGLFNQSLAQGIPVSFVATNERTIKAMIKLVELTIIQGSTFNQYIVNEFLANGMYERCLRKNKEIYARKQQLMYSELEKGRELGIKYLKNIGGSFVWCKLPEDVDSRKVYRMAISEGIYYYPGSMFYLNKRKGSQYMRLSFIYPSEEKIVYGIEKLLKIVKACK